MSPKSKRSCSSPNSKNREKLAKAWSALLRTTQWRWFVTLTFRRNVRRRTAAREFREYVARLQREEPANPIHWVFVVDTGSDGRVHIHALLANTGRPERRFISDAWQHGYSDVRGFDDARDGAVSYIAGKIASATHDHYDLSIPSSGANFPDGEIIGMGQPTTAIRSNNLARRRYQKGSLELVGGVWKARYREDVCDSNGVAVRVQRHPTLGTIKELPTERLARRELDRLLAPLNSIDYRPRVDITFAELSARWMRDVVVHLSRATAQHYRSDLQHHLLPAFGAVPLRDMSGERTQQFVTRLAMKVGAKTVRNVVAVLGSVWATARSWNYVTHDITRGLRLPKVEHTNRRYFTELEVTRILAAAKQPDATLYHLVAETGLRGGEVSALKWEDVDFDKRELRVIRSSWRGTLKSTKSVAGQRTILLSPTLTQRLFLLRGKSSSEFVFVNKFGAALKADKLVSRKLQPLLKKLGIPAGGLHAFRRFNGTMMDVLAAPIKLRQRRLGHVDPGVTLSSYTDSRNSEEKQFVDEMARVLCPDVPLQEGSDDTNDLKRKLIQ